MPLSLSAYHAEVNIAALNKEISSNQDMITAAPINTAHFQRQAPGLPLNSVDTRLSLLLCRSIWWTFNISLILKHNKHGRQHALETNQSTPI
jgi:hypothetical protein